MEITDAQWERIRKLFNNAFNSSFHYHFDSFEPVHAGVMTRDLWKD